MPFHSSLILKVLFSSLLILGISNPGLAQNMYKQFVHVNNKWRISPGLYAGEPLGGSLYFYKGANCKSRRPWTIRFDVGKDAGLYGTNDKTYSTGYWQKGSIQYSVLLFYTVPGHLNPRGNNPVLNILDNFNLGAGLQFGKRQFKAPDLQEYQVNTTGVAVALNAYVYSYMLEMKKKNYLLFTVVPELKYYNEFGADFSYFRPGVAVIVDIVR